MMRFCFLALLLVAAGNTSVAQPGEKAPDKVLFIGNSFSYFNNGLHNHLSNLVRAEGRWKAGNNRFRLLTLSGGKLSEQLHIVPGFMKGTDAKWDLVVIHDYSTGPLQDEAKSGFQKSARALVQAIRDQGSEAMFLMTWAYEGQPQMTAPLAKAYGNLGKELGVDVAPVGLAFANVLKAHPDIRLHSADVLGFSEGAITYKRAVKHPSVAGTYLAACVFYSTFYGKSAAGIPYHADLPQEVAEKLQSIAWETVKAYNGSD